MSAAFGAGGPIDPVTSEYASEIRPGGEQVVDVDLRAAMPVPFEQLEPGTARWTLRTAKPDGSPAELVETSWLLPEKRFPCVPAEGAIEIDGDVGEWGSLRFQVASRPGPGHGESSPVSFDFDVRCDEAFAYFGVAVRDPVLYVPEREIGRRQDGVQLVLDARPDPERSENQHFFEAAMSGAIRKMRFPVILKEAIWRRTDPASMTKTPPTKKRSISCFVMQATRPSAPPSGREPESPRKTSAGWPLNQRNPRVAPSIAVQKTVVSALAAI